MRIAKPIPALSASDASRFWDKIDRSAGADGCWLWRAGLSGDGYGRFKLGGALFSPHRIAYQIANGPIPPKMKRCLVLHSCNTPGCCNPKHLRLGTGSQNNKDAIAAGRWDNVTANLPHKKARIIGGNIGDNPDDLVQPIDNVGGPGGT